MAQAEDDRRGYVQLPVSGPKTPNSGTNLHKILFTGQRMRTRRLEFQQPIPHAAVITSGLIIRMRCYDQAPFNSSCSILGKGTRKAFHPERSKQAESLVGSRRLWIHASMPLTWWHSNYFRAEAYHRHNSCRYSPRPPNAKIFLPVLVYLMLCSMPAAQS